MNQVLQKIWDLVLKKCLLSYGMKFEVQIIFLAQSPGETDSFPQVSTLCNKI